MKTKIALLAIAGAALVSFSGCKPSLDQIRAAIEANPDIVFNVIEQNPEKFMEVVNSAFQKAQVKQREKEQADLESARDAEYKNPLQPVIDPSRAVRGAANAPITIVEYSDFQCPFCQRGADTLKKIEDKYKDKVRLVFKHLPLKMHDEALPAAQWFEAVALQSPEKAYQFHDKLWQNQQELGVDFYKKVAAELKLDVAKLEADAKSEKVKARIDADMAEAEKFKFQGTPGFLINGVSIRGAMPQAEFEKVIDKLLGNTAPTKAPAPAAAPAA
jgi:protein-disulfide isomerase